MKTTAVLCNRLWVRRLSGITVWLALLASARASSGEATFRAEGDELLVQTPTWTLALDAAKGSIRRLEDRRATGTLLHGGPHLWVIQRHKQPDITSSDCTLKHAWDATAEALTLEFDGPDAAARIVCRAADEGPAWQARVHIKRGTMVGWRFPSVEFDVAGLEEFILPENLGLAFSRSFFEPGGAGMARHLLGPAGLEKVAHDRCLMRPVRDPAVPVQPGKDAGGWLPDWYLKEMPRWRVTADRCPASDKHDLSLLETEHGCWLSGYHLGGWGWLFRLGGILGRNESRPVVASVIATLSPAVSHSAHCGKRRGGAPRVGRQAAGTLAGAAAANRHRHGPSRRTAGRATAAQSKTLDNRIGEAGLGSRRQNRDRDAGRSCPTPRGPGPAAAVVRLDQHLA